MTMQRKVYEQEQQSSSFLLDALYCEEEKWEEEEVFTQENTSSIHTVNNRNSRLFPLPLLKQDLFWEDEELLSLFSREEEQHNLNHLNQGNVITDPSLFLARREGVEWIVKVNDRYGFSVLTAVLAIDYLDRFLCNPSFQKDKPWMVQLVSVTCLSLAAKVEETQVPLLLDFQVVEASTYVFEPKTIQRMELLVLSALKWEMRPVTPLSFVDHIMRRLGLKNHVHWEFHRRCASVLLSAVSDSRFMGFVPSVLATATMMHVIDQVEPFNPIRYQNQLLGVLDTANKKVKECHGLIVELTNTHKTNSNKRKSLLCEQIILPGCPIGRIDGAFSCECDGSKYSWSVGSSEPPPPLLKKSKRTQDQEKPLLFSMDSVCVDIVGSPR